MGIILKPTSLSRIIKKIKVKKHSIVLTGGCFDVIHPGHIVFLQKAKKAGNRLIVLLESDENIKKIKGINRPVHNQNQRAKVLSALATVDFIVKLPFMDTDEKYDRLVKKISPDVIAAARGAADNHHKERSAKLCGGKLVYVTKIIGNHSTSRILNH